jgi:oxygen-independent coproporphyrinogen-3 oxidase
MYGLPGQSLRSWSETLERLLDLEPDHVSLYPLSIEPGTVFFRRQGQLGLPEDDRVVEMYALAGETLQHAGFEHYEVANWARPGQRSRHNMAYWLDRPFVAVGVGAHGYLRDARYENMRGVKRYIEAVSAGDDVTASREVLDEATRLDEWVMLRLRLLQEGIDVRELRELYGTEVAAKACDTARKFPAQIVVDGERLRLREEAVPIANEVWAGFMGLLDQTGGRPLDLAS